MSLEAELARLDLAALAQLVRSAASDAEAAALLYEAVVETLAAALLATADADRLPRA